MGARFTCTLKTLKKMLMRRIAPSGVVMDAVSVTRPSPGETIKPLPWNGAMRIAEKPEEKRRQKYRGDAPAPGACKPGKRRGHS